MSCDSEEDLDLTRKEYLQERASLVSLKSAQVKLFDRTLILISTGALALSLTFIKDIAPKINPGTLGLLKVAWLSFSLSLLFVLIGYLVGKFAYEKAIIDLEKVYYPEKSDKNEEDNDNNGKSTFFSKRSFLSWIVDAFNVASVITIFVGSVYLVIFSWRNLV